MTTRAYAPNSVRGVNLQDRTIDVIASTFSVDSYKTRIDPNGWRLDRFRSQPRILWAHDSYGMTASAGMPVAKGENVRVENGQLKMTLRFPSKETDEFGNKVFRMMAEGFIDAVSVGFDPIKEERANEDGENIMIYREQELVETSVVSIPANTDAVAQRAYFNERAQKLNRTPEELMSAFEELESLFKQRFKDIESDEQRKHREYFERKQPANRASTKVLEKFFRQRDEQQPSDEVEAWQRMAELIEQEETTAETGVAKPVEEPVVETPVEAVADTTVEPVAAQEETAEEITTESTTPVQVAPEPERTASVQVPLSVLLELPSRMARSYTEAAIVALREGTPIGEVGKLIDGLNSAAVQSFSTTFIHGNH